MKIVTVIPLAKGVFKENLTYFTTKEIANGNIVSITVRNKKMLGLVVDCTDASGAKSDIKDLAFNLKKINEVKENAIFSKEYLDSSLQVGNYFCAKKNDIITSLLPTAFRENYDQISKLNKKETILKKEPARNAFSLADAGGSIQTEKLLFQASLEDRISYYKTFIRSSFADKKSIFLVLPTEREIEIFYEALAKGIENFSYLLHSGLSAKKQIEKFKAISNSEHPVLIIGTAPFLSISRSDLGSIILEKESSPSYHMLGRPFIDLRNFVELYATKIKAKLILADSLLRFETIARKEIDNLGEVRPMSFRANFKGEIEVLGKSEKFKIINDVSVQEIKNSLKEKKNVFIFSLRKGLATMTVCRDCQEPVMCQKCSAPVVLYLSRDNKKRMFICNRCGTEKSPETRCTHCDSWNLMPLGIGTDTVSEEIKKLFPKIKIFKLDKEIAKTAVGAKKIIDEFEKSSGAILVGTEMALFYLTQKLPLTVIASFDSLWSIPNFKMSEKIIQLMLGILNKTENKLIIQTKNDQDPAILAVQTENILAFIREDLNDRKILNYPPFKTFIKITHLGTKEETLHAKKALAEVFKEYQSEIFSGFVAKQKDKYVTNTLIKIAKEKWSLFPNLNLDQNLFSKLSSLPPQFSVTINPDDLL